MDGLDDLKQAWQRLELRVAHLELDATERARAARVERSRAALRASGAGELVQLAIWFAIVAVAAPFWIRHRGTPHLLVAGLSLHVYGVAAIIAGIMRLLLVGRVYVTRPVVVMQRHLAELRRLQVRASLAFGLAWWLLWVPAVMVGAMLVAGVDLYAACPAWIWLSLAAGAVGLVASLAAARWLARRSVRSPALRRIIEELAGRSLARAARELDEIDRFTAE